MGNEIELRRTTASPATPTSGAATEWVPLRSHPVFASTASYYAASASGKPGNLLAWDSSSSRLYLWDLEKSGVHRLSVRFGDDPHDPDSIQAAVPSKILFPDVRLQISVHNVAVNRAGTCLVLAGSGGLYVMYLFKQTSSKDGSALCRTVFIGSQLYLGDQNFVHVLQASWHPHSDTHLGVLSSDSVFRLFDLSSDVDKAEQEFYLQPAEHGRCHDAVSICPVAFSFGGEHLWERFSVFVLFSDGFVYIICPVVPFGSIYSRASIDEMYKDAQTLGLMSCNPRAVNNSTLAISWLEATFPEIAVQSTEGSTPLALKAHSYMSFDACLSLQGPLGKVSHIEENEGSGAHRVECEGRAVGFLHKSISKDSVLVIAWSSGQMHIDALTDEVVPLWNTSNSPRLRVDPYGHVVGVAMICEPSLQENSSPKFDLQASQENLDTVWLGNPPPLLRLAFVDLALPTSSIAAGSLLLFSDPLFSEKFYCLHIGGLDLLSLHFLPFSCQSSGKDECAKDPSVFPVLTTRCSDSSPLLPLCGFIALESPFGNSWIIGITSSYECVVMEMKGWDTTLAIHLDGAQKSASASEELEMEPPNIISKELLLGPRAVLVPQGSSVLNPESIEGRSTLHHYFKLFHENYVEYAHKVYIELKHHADHLKGIIADQHKRLSNAKHMLRQVEEKQPSLDDRIKHALQFYQCLEERLQAFQGLPGAKKKPLSKAEREFKFQLDRYKELELDALHSSIATLDARLRRNTQPLPAKTNVTSRQIPGVRRNLVLENQILQLKSSIAKLSLVNSENSKKVKLVESALASVEHDH